MVGLEGTVEDLMRTTVSALHATARDTQHSLRYTKTPGERRPMRHHFVCFCSSKQRYATHKTFKSSHSLAVEHRTNQGLHFPFAMDGENETQIRVYESKAMKAEGCRTSNGKIPKSCWCSAAVVCIPYATQHATCTLNPTRIKNPFG